MPLHKTQYFKYPNETSLYLKRSYSFGLHSTNSYNCLFFHVWAGEKSSPLDSLKGLWKEEMFALWIAFYKLCLFRILVPTVWFSHTTTSHLMWTKQLTLCTTAWLPVQALSSTLSPYRHGNTETLKTSNKCSVIPTMLANFYQFFLILCLGSSLEGSGPLDFPLNFELMCSYAYVFLLVLFL